MNPFSEGKYCTKLYICDKYLNILLNTFTKTKMLFFKSKISEMYIKHNCYRNIVDIAFENFFK